MAETGAIYTRSGFSSSHVMTSIEYGGLHFRHGQFSSGDWFEGAGNHCDCMTFGWYTVTRD